MAPNKNSRGGQKRKHFVTNLAQQTFADTKLHNIWQASSVWCEYINEKFGLVRSEFVLDANSNKRNRAAERGLDVLLREEYHQRSLK